MPHFVTPAALKTISSIDGIHVVENRFSVVC